ncbi:uncharacterized protein PITG_11718 [Phytophthora infestans T30-4]|uniref:Uncharacterized protein n=1 Tax=Phytophthora infestans (strain T30-4) TaxID=403677 RepID=D0NIE0_PHYIT|nr:uncharacterized protein PITG_11718 [Phytophthora infestans T30-4]EEY59225.1 hypothetical protein PITG_11718 [Phytophthora infestans T30-4]|eukprot:XP_002901239.1 hypothetical protein PITG_11718 [Phytophthora infestans T30-4]
MITVVYRYARGSLWEALACFSANLELRLSLYYHMHLVSRSLIQATATPHEDRHSPHTCLEYTGSSGSSTGCSFKVAAARSRRENGEDLLRSWMWFCVLRSGSSAQAYAYIQPGKYPETIEQSLRKKKRFPKPEATATIMPVSSMNASNNDTD